MTDVILTSKRTNINPKTGKGLRFVDRTNHRNGRLCFISLSGKSIHGHHIWKAKCDCGNVTFTSTPHKTKSCGCLQKETIANIQKAKKHSPELRKLSIQLNASKQRLKRKTNPVKAMHARLSRLHRHALSQVNAIKTSPTFEMLGYTVVEFVSHIEKQFYGGMSWSCMDKWQIDHIIPISLAEKLDDVIRLNALSNLRPLWKKENNQKKNKVMTLL